MKILRIIVLVLAAAAAMPSFAQSKAPADKPAVDTMQILREKLKADKKLVVATNMVLTPAEAKGFWPLYEEYQKELQQINDHLATVLVAYSKEYTANSLTDDKASALLDRYFAIEEAELKLKRAFVPRLAKVLPGIKVARYMQIENKIRAIVKYELAGEVPLATQ